MKTICDNCDRLSHEIHRLRDFVWDFADRADVILAQYPENAATALTERSGPYGDEPAWIEGLARTLLNAKRATDRKAADWIRNGETR